ncbi:HPP family protein [Vibrio sp. NH-UV-68]|uniref:HPP family protein n=1 Tax=unclassified Vibrio TaxID=2614977 RepID=UPI0036F1C30B
MNNKMLALVAGFGAALAIGLLSIVEASLHDVALLMAPFGATAVLVFGVPDSPLAQAKNVIVGHMITALIGVVFVEFFSVSPLSLAAGTGLGVSVMLLTKTTHPPAGANPILIMLAGQSWSFLISPVLIGAVTIVLVGKSLRIIQSRYVQSY